MILPDRMFSADWIRDERLRRLPAHVQLLLLFIRHLCDRNGRFEFNPALIHMALYASAKVSNVSARDVEAWLEILRAGGYIKTYTGAAGRRVGEVAREYWRQKLSYGKDAFEPEAEQPELALPLADPPKERKLKKGGRGKEPPPPFTSYPFVSPPQSPAGGQAGGENVGDTPAAQQRGTGRRSPATPVDEHGHPETEAVWLARMQDEWPHIDIVAELRKAHKKKAGEVERGWFEKSWLPNVTAKAPAPGALHAPGLPVSAEPANWREVLEQIYPGNAVSSDPERTWASLDATTRAKIALQAKQGRAA